MILQPRDARTRPRLFVRDGVIETRSPFTSDNQNHAGAAYAPFPFLLFLYYIP